MALTSFLQPEFLKLPTSSLREKISHSFESSTIRCCSFGLVLAGKFSKVDEIHVRRFHDREGAGSGFHHKVVAAITIGEKVQKVWQVLTDYNNYPIFINGLLSTAVLPWEGKEHLKFLSCKMKEKNLLIELRETRNLRLGFRMVDGDFDVLHGEWILQTQEEKCTRLKLKVDVATKLISGKRLEEVIHEDLPLCLCAIRSKIESSDYFPSTSHEIFKEKQLLKIETLPCDSVSRSSLFEFNEVDEQVLKTDSILEIELRSFIDEFGEADTMPTRQQLRDKKRFDLEVAIRRAGGFHSVATQYGLKLSNPRKQRHYWDEFNNIRRAVAEVQEELGCPPSVMPTRSAIIGAGKRDLARAFERWGGMQEVAQLLNLEMKSKKAPKSLMVDDKGRDNAQPMKPVKLKGPSKKDSKNVQDIRESTKGPVKATLPSVSKWRTMASSDESSS